MTTNKFLFYWSTNKSWWKYDENRKPVLLDSAPPKAKMSYDEYLKHKKKYL